MQLLEVRDVSAAYPDGVEVLHKINISVREGEMVTLIGANGAGKTTTLRAIMGLVRSSGSVKFMGQDILGRETPDIARIGISMVPEGRGVFPGLSVYDNLRVATTPWFGRGQSMTDDLDRVYALFPILAERRKQLGWSLSGGQQQMLAIGRAIMARLARCDDDGNAHGEAVDDRLGTATSARTWSFSQTIRPTPSVSLPRTTS